MWLPTSTCDSGCLPRPGEVPRAAPWVILARVIAVVAVVSAAIVMLPLLPASRVPAVLPRLARTILRATGVRHEARGRLARHGALVVANHVSWLDVLVLMAHTPCRLLAKREVGTWPVIGRLATAAGTLFIDRSRPRALPATVGQVAAALRSGGVVAAFPEGTTWCGRAGGRFRPALFQAAISAGVAVAPVRLGFRLPEGTTTTVVAYIADDSLLGSVWRVITTRRLLVTAQAYPALHPVEGSSRRVLASAVQAVVWPDQRSGQHPLQPVAPPVDPHPAVVALPTAA
jgi:1-acyl-sn-glycerol-3-phosphate acyltransferase